MLNAKRTRSSGAASIRKCTFHVNYKYLNKNISYKMFFQKCQLSINTYHAHAHSPSRVKTIITNC